MERLVCLLDVDNTLFDNDKAQQDYLAEIEVKVNRQAARRYWNIFEQIRDEAGYADYLGALQCYRLEDMHDPGLLRVSSYLLDYPFNKHLYPKVKEVIDHLREMGLTAILTDGDVVFQPRKVERSGLWEAVRGNVLIYVHKEKELREVEKRFPAEHYVLVDDKLRILSAVKSEWGSRVTTVFVRQGHYATDPKLLAAYPPGDVNIDSIEQLLRYSKEDLLRAGSAGDGRSQKGTG